MINETNLIQYFTPPPCSSMIGDEFFNPFSVDVHPLTLCASEKLQTYLINITEREKIKATIFGVLVVKDKEGQIGFLSAFSGQSPFHELCGETSNNDKRISFVPFISITDDRSYQLNNALGESKSINELFHNPLSLKGVGDCAGPKLLQYAYLHEYNPVALAEFWFGSSANDQMRHHQHFYPSCRGKCWPILPFMMQGLKVKPLIVPGFCDVDENLPVVVFEDEYLLLVNKPAGLLSVPGKEINDSVLTRLQKRYPDATGPLLLHRLDLLTSGLLLVAKSETIHKLLQQQFLNRTIKKRYIALLSLDNESNIAETGIIDLPLRVDIEDRPRQMVCHEHGKKSQTKWQVISRGEKNIRIYFYPITGRTHQLRVHAAHYAGLNFRIIGDHLYGVKSGENLSDTRRLMLHAEQLIFIHPVSGEKMVIKSPAPF